MPEQWAVIVRDNLAAGLPSEEAVQAANDALTELATAQAALIEGLADAQSLEEVRQAAEAAGGV